MPFNILPARVGPRKKLQKRNRAIKSAMPSTTIDKTKSTDKKLTLLPSLTSIFNISKMNRDTKEQLRTQLALVDGRLTQALAKVTGIPAQLAKIFELEQKNEQLAIQVSQLTKAKTDAERSLDESISALHRANSTVEGLEKANASLSRQIVAMKKENHTLVTKNSQLAQVNLWQDVKLKSIEASEKELCKEKLELVAINEPLTRKCNALQATNEELVLEIDELKNANKAQAKTNAELCERSTQLHNEVTVLKTRPNDTQVTKMPASLYSKTTGSDLSSSSASATVGDTGSSSFMSSSDSCLSLLDEIFANVPGVDVTGLRSLASNSPQGFTPQSSEVRDTSAHLRTPNDAETPNPAIKNDRGISGVTMRSPSSFNFGILPTAITTNSTYFFGAAHDECPEIEDINLDSKTPSASSATESSLTTGKQSPAIEDASAIMVMKVTKQIALENIEHPKTCGMVTTTDVDSTTESNTYSTKSASTNRAGKPKHGKGKKSQKQKLLENWGNGKNKGRK